jgi:hypothetical protein
MELMPCESQGQQVMAVSSLSFGKFHTTPDSIDIGQFEVRLQEHHWDDEISATCAKLAIVVNKNSVYLQRFTQVKDGNVNPHIGATNQSSSKPLILIYKIHRLAAC